MRKLELVKSTPLLSVSQAQNQPEPERIYKVGVRSWDAANRYPFTKYYLHCPATPSVYVVSVRAFMGWHTFRISLDRQSHQKRFLHQYEQYPDDPYGNAFTIDIPPKWKNGCYLTMLEFEDRVVLCATETEVPTGTLILQYQKGDMNLIFLSLQHMHRRTEEEKFIEMQRFTTKNIPSPRRV